MIAQASKLFEFKKKLDQMCNEARKKLWESDPGAKFRVGDKIFRKPQ